MSTPRTIIARMYGTAANEGKATGTIKPGHVVKSHSSDGTFVVNDITAAVMGVEVAIEDDFQGKTVADAYSAASGADWVRTRVLNAGDRFYARAAAGLTTKIGTLLSLTTGGQVTLYTDGTARFKALEAVTTATADDFVLVEVL